MDAIKNFIKSRSIGYWFSLVSALFALIALISYGVYSGDAIVGGGVITMLVIGFVINVAVLIYPIKLVEFIPYIMYFGAVGLLIINDMNFISNVFVGIDHQSFASAYISTFVGLFGAMIIGIVPCILSPANKRNI